MCSSFGLKSVNVMDLIMDKIVLTPAPAAARVAGCEISRAQIYNNAPK